jgi:hypothetical protein
LEVGRLVVRLLGNRTGMRELLEIPRGIIVLWRVCFFYDVVCEMCVFDS